MKKNVYLICNSHLDPVWQWDWQEGESAAISTFYAAVDLLKEPGSSLVFNHNEVFLYEKIEKDDPELFKEIKELVKKKKWHIMGGYYIQPDAMVPSGESQIRQIALGREYFKEKFNVRVTSANNFDAFAHTRGLPSILKKCGYDSYIFCRPMPFHDLFSRNPLPTGPFLWEGYDGSKIKALRFDSYYFTPRGTTIKKINERINLYSKENDICVLWGVGNHGGCVSREDLKDIKNYAKENKDKYLFKHSTLEEYFSKVNPKKVVDEELLCFFKSYSSCHLIKNIHDELENTLYLAEKICTEADLNNYYHYDLNTFKEAEKTLALIEFHDVLSGTAIRSGTESSVSKARGAIENLKNELFTAFSSFARHLPKVTPNDDNLVIYNHNPYTYKGLVTSEFSSPLPCQELDYMYQLTLYDEHNHLINFQKIKEESELNYDRRFRLIYEVEIPPCTAISIGIHKEKVKRSKKESDDNNDIIYHDDIKDIVISRETGLLTSFKVEGKEFLSGPSGVPTLFFDNEDPWGWYLNRFDSKVDLYHNNVKFDNSFVPIKSPKTPSGIFKGLKSVSVIEKGDLLWQVQCLFECHESHIVINYLIYKNKPFIDMNIHTVWMEQMKGLKIKFALNGSKTYLTQAAFGIECKENNGFEYPCNRYVANQNGDKLFALYNRSGIHSTSKSDDNLYLTLLNGSVYCAHPIDKDNNEMETDREIIKDRRRFLNYMEFGTHDFSLRLAVNDISELERYQKEFNEPLYSLYYFPHGENDLNKGIIKVTNSRIVVTALKKRKDGSYFIRLYNGSFKNATTTLDIVGIKKQITFNKFEFKTFIYKDKKIIESDDAALY